MQWYQQVSESVQLLTPCSDILQLCNSSGHDQVLQDQLHHAAAFLSVALVEDLHQVLVAFKLL